MIPLTEKESRKALFLLLLLDTKHFGAAKILPQAEFISAEDFNRARGPHKMPRHFVGRQKQLDELHIAIVGDVEKDD